MKAFLIDPEFLTITEVDCDSSIQDIYRYIDADCFDCIRLNDENDTIYVDDNGLYTKHHFWRYGDYSNPIAGKGLVLGADYEGESTAPAVVTLESLKDTVVFITTEEAITMGEVVDARNKEMMEQHDNFIAFPVADIIKDSEYTDGSGE